MPPRQDLGIALNHLGDTRRTRTKRGSDIDRTSSHKEEEVLKQFAVAFTAALVLGSIGTGAALADNGADDLGGHRVDRLHQHQGTGPRGPHHPYGPHHNQGNRRGHGRPAA